MSGYLYCFSNESLKNLYKIGMTTRTVEDRLKEANSSTWCPPNFKIELSVKVKPFFVAVPEKELEVVTSVIPLKTLKVPPAVVREYPVPSNKAGTVQFSFVKYPVIVFVPSRNLTIVISS